MYYGYGFYPRFDPTMILILIGVALSMAASAQVNDFIPISNYLPATPESVP